MVKKSTSFESLRSILAYDKKIFSQYNNGQGKKVMLLIILVLLHYFSSYA